MKSLNPIIVTIIICLTTYICIHECCKCILACEAVKLGIIKLKK